MVKCHSPTCSGLQQWVTPRRTPTGVPVPPSPETVPCEGRVVTAWPRARCREAWMSHNGRWGLLAVLPEPAVHLTSLQHQPAVADSPSRVQSAQDSLPVAQGSKRYMMGKAAVNGGGAALRGRLRLSQAVGVPLGIWPDLVQAGTLPDRATPRAHGGDRSV